jgi:hypothetical protein
MSPVPHEDGPPKTTNGPTHNSLLTITPDEAADRATTLTLVHEELEALHAATAQVAENVGAVRDIALEKGPSQRIRSAHSERPEPPRVRWSCDTNCGSGPRATRDRRQSRLFRTLA